MASNFLAKPRYRQLVQYRYNTVTRWFTIPISRYMLLSTINTVSNVTR